MPPKGSSLASLLGTLTNAAPVDFDPEALDADQPGPSTTTTADDSDAGSESQDDQDEDDAEEEEEYTNPRAHYADVGPSEMRKRAALSESDKIKDARYQGVKSSRAELYGDDEEEDEEEDEEDEVTGSGSEDLSEESDGDDEEEESDANTDSAPTKTKKQLRFASDDDASATTDEDDSDNAAEPTNPASASASIAAQIAQSATQAKALKARRLEDAEKGRAVRKQIKTYERTLETRIKAQSVLRDVNRLPDPSVYSDILRTSPSTMEPAIGLLEQLLELSETLFSLRTRLDALSHEGDGSGAVSAPTTRKRKRDFDVTVPEDEEEAVQTWREITAHDQIEATLSDISHLSRSAEPYRRSVLDKWSLKVTSAAASSANKFAPSLRAVNQTPSAQIDSALAGDGESRLIARTRVLRDSDKLGHPSATEEVRDDEVFDDSDFYSTLLKELIERRSGTASTPTTAAMMLNGLSGKKKKANVDTKASKGRKLRYEVNEKLVNFMPPIGDRLRWGEEQIERLFRQLAKSSVAVEGGEEEEKEDGEEEAALEGLRVFG